MASENNFPAFPATRAENIGNQLAKVTYPGMTLRDYFAGQVMPACFAADYGNAWVLSGKDHAKAAARRAYAWADAMLAAQEDN
ncbi:hypothetical protein GRI72_02780 [Altererythrobacter marinus]|uniref:Uncharacterized protein n=1 Tax=Pelagerythrobacter marinus TaxID=538382 RepID=A0ABW9UWP0_9SPHN|nr:hypothetical protein [Pelagerythrobacter marinus]MXO67757.1 hypothetical protein [Pelagerythrobacter marinus]